MYCVSTKGDGNMAVTCGDEATVHANRAAFLSRFGIEEADVIVLHPEHKDLIVRVGKDKAGTAVNAEALMTNERGVALALPTADCFPVAFYDEKHEAIALAHCGWRPTGLRLAEKVMLKMTEAFGTNPKEVRIFIGPGIHPESYLVEGAEQAEDPAWAKYVQGEGGKTRVDVFTFLYDQLIDAGVPCSHIDADPVDTAMADEYFSHYRSVRTGEPEGRFMTVLALESI